MIFFVSLAFSVVPAIVVFSILFGVALIGVKNKAHFVDLLSTVGDTLMTMTAFIGRPAPYGFSRPTLNGWPPSKVLHGRFDIRVST
ncbi:dicarboxylate/amino acid:cation symporter [Thiocapsa bogorovii]|uniref:dicarboxylate/amino acid:cation symporter n=1 Tax=Thiocapsa bogorovii TaxID=521689 RepID=UPI001E5F8453|nr:dicarboxylate/amino acid:cation symporter [Thiocapsa bogorovii]UHD17570.1 dicarboxylate/amino acid:cation symporter [Thiocapsa bogorovii]